MIDLHTHILPAMDDGARNTAESLAMLSASYLQGVRVCVATPHCLLHETDSVETFLARRRDCCRVLSDALRDALRQEKSKFPEILLGAEVYLDHDISKMAQLERLCIGQTDYMLVEFPLANQSHNTADWVYSLILRGIRPVIAHVDRYLASEQLLEELAELELVYQINASRFLSCSGRKMIRQLLRQFHENFVVSSDMHNVSNRKCNMKPACDIARKKYPHLVSNLFCDRARNMLQSSAVVEN